MLGRHGQKVDVALLSNEYLNLSVSQEWMDELSWYFSCWCKVRKIENYFNSFCVVVAKNWRETGSLISERTDKVRWFFACSYIFMKAKNYVSTYCVGIVKYGCGLLGKGTVKSAVSEEWIGELSWFYTCWKWCDTFWLDH